MKLLIMGISLIYLTWFILTFFLSCWFIIYLPIPVLVDFSIVVRLIILQVVISSDVRDIEVIHIPIRNIIISVPAQLSPPGFCVRLVCPHLIEGQIPLSLIVYPF